jgi:D-threo-aldose 1-dehydrogenase
MASQTTDKPSAILPSGMPRLGFGCGDLYGGASYAASARLVATALDSGIRYFDVARLYGNGSAETVLGRILPRVRDQVIIVSKAGILPYSMLRWTQFIRRAAKAARMAGPLARALVAAPPPSAARFGAFGLGDLARSVGRSLKALRTDYLDILLLHECSVADARQPEVLEFLERLRTQGKIRRFGIATHFPETIEILNAVPRIAPIAQFASDALNRDVGRLPAFGLDLVVTHSSVRYILPRLIDHLTADPAAAARWAERTGIASGDRSKIAGLLLADAVAENASGVVLFSSSRPERIAEAASTRPLDLERSAALREELARIPRADASGS